MEESPQICGVDVAELDETHSELSDVEMAGHAENEDLVK